MKNYYFILSFLLLQFLGVQDVSAGYCVSQGDGTWGNASTWSCGRVPGSGDTIIVRAQDSIYVANSYTGLTGVWLQVYGKLEFKNAARIVFMYGDTTIAPSMITFYTGAVCAGGNGSSGLSFGSGGSGCDVYRPGQGTNPGVYPTVPGSYYDGCVWASYLPISGLNAKVYILDDKMKFEWSIYENNFIDFYEVIGISDGHEVPIDIIPSQQKGFDLAEYSNTYPIAGLLGIQVVGHQYNESEVNIALGTVDQLLPVIAGDVNNKPNPFDKHIEVSSKFSFDIKIYTLDGQVLYEGIDQNYYRVNTTSFTSGMYYLEISKNSNVLNRRKILKL